MKKSTHSPLGEDGGEAKIQIKYSQREELLGNCLDQVERKRARLKQGTLISRDLGLQYSSHRVGLGSNKENLERIQKTPRQQARREC